MSVRVQRCTGEPPQRREYKYERRAWADYAESLISGECTYLVVTAPGPEFNSARTCLIGAIKSRGRRAKTYADSKGNLIVTLRSRRGGV